MSKVYMVIAPRYEYNDNYYDHRGDQVERCFSAREKADKLARALNEELVARVRDPDQYFLESVPISVRYGSKISLEEALHGLESYGHGIHRVVEIEVES